MADVRVVELGTHLAAIESERVVGVMGVVARPDRVGLIFPPELDDAPEATETVLVEAAIARLRRDGAIFAQLTLAPEEYGQAVVFERAGFRLLTDAIVLERGLGGKTCAPTPPHPDFVAIECDPVADEDLLSELIGCINVGSLDSPELDDWRTPQDVLNSHRLASASGRDRWRRYEVQGKAAGIALTCMAEDEDAWEVLFFGVHPDFRGQGLGRLMLTEVIAQADGQTPRIRGAMDVRNRFAKTCYEAAGFLECGRVRVWVLPLGRGV